MIAISIGGQGLLIALIFFMIIFRENYGCHMIWFILYVVFFLTMIFVLVMLSIPYAECNDPNQPKNICNDLQWCCVYYIDPTNNCGKDTSCDPPVTSDQLRPKPSFLGLYWTNASLVILHFIFFIVLIVYWFAPGPKVAEPEAEQEQISPEEQQAVMVELTGNKNWSQKRTGLRERKRK